jgi:phage gp36-like protein
MAYATPAQFLVRYDARRLGQLVRDDGTKATPAELLSDDNLAAVLDDASGMIDAAVLRGGRYESSDLTDLTGQSEAYLVRLCCDLAYGLLVERRGFSQGEAQVSAGGYTRALQTLDQLAEGQRVFNVDKAIQAGKPRRAVIDKKLQLISSTRRLFGDLTVREANPGNPTDFGD